MGRWNKLPDGPWPSIPQRDLLRACLLAREPALAAWEKWQRENSLEHTDTGSFRLLPLLYHQLCRHGVDDSGAIEILRGVNRYHWLCYQFSMKKLRRALELFSEAGIPVMLAKGAALNLVAYPRPGLRPMHDVDLIVSRDRFPEAYDLMARNGWRSPVTFDDTRMRWGHAIELRDTEQHRIDLHWRVFKGSSDTGMEERSFDRSEEFDWDGLSVNLLKTEDHLVRLCEHGVNFGPEPGFRWLADTFFLLENRTWKSDYLVESALQAGQERKVRETLRYLREQLDWQDGKEAEEQLYRKRQTFSQHLTYYLLTRATRETDVFLRNLPAYLAEWWLNSGDLPIRKRLKSLSEALPNLHQVEEPLSHVIRQSWLLKKAGWRSRWEARKRRKGLPGNAHFRSIQEMNGEEARGFYPGERWGEGILQWSRTDFSLMLDLSPCRQDMQIHLAPIRSWEDDLRVNLIVSINGNRVPNDMLRYEDDCLSFELRKSDLVKTGPQEILVRCAALKVEGGDLRQLGLPVLAVGWRERPED